MNTDTLLPEYEAFDQLATMVAIARSDGHCLLANSTLENAVAVSRRALLRGNVLDWFIDPLPMRETLLALQRSEVTGGRFEAQLKRAPLGSFEPLLVRVSASQMEMVSFGKLHPAVSGSGESAWSKNRRDEFKVSKPK